ncbi:hypothetical protein ACOMHN_049556 [Nucella lapillus]
MSFVILGAVGALDKRSDDLQPLETVVQNLSSQVLGLQAKLSAVENSLQQLQATQSQRVAFTASIGQQNLDAAPGHIIPFTHVTTNVGNAYDANTSAFTVPYDGQYFIFVSVDVSSYYRALHVTRNGQSVIPGHNDVDGNHIVAGGALTLKAGDEITVNHDMRAVGIVDGGPEAIFCGFKI